MSQPAFFVHDVQVIKGEPPEGNPYKAVASGQALMFTERVYALWLVYTGADAADDYTLWYAPSCGGAKRITSADIRWDLSGIPSIKGDWCLKDGDVVCGGCGAVACLTGGMYCDEGMSQCKCR